MALKLKLDEVREESERAAASERNAMAYLQRMMGQQLCSRLTIPLTSKADMLDAAAVLSQLADQLKELAQSDMELTSRLLAARSQCYRAHRTLKKGARWNGSTR